MHGLSETQGQTFQLFPLNYQVLKCLLQESKENALINYVSINKISISWTEASGSVIMWQLVWAGVLVVLFYLMLCRGS